MEEGGVILLGVVGSEAQNQPMMSRWWNSARFSAVTEVAAIFKMCVCHSRRITEVI